MSELISKLTRRIIELTPTFASDRVADVLLGLPESHLIQGEFHDYSTWYQDSRTTKEDRNGDMGVNERIWFLLEAKPREREQWVKLIRQYDKDRDLEEIEEVFEYEPLVSRDGYSTGLGPTAIRARFFSDFLSSLSSTRTLESTRFKDKLAKLSRDRAATTRDHYKRMTDAWER